MQQNLSAIQVLLALASQLFTTSEYLNRNLFKYTPGHNTRAHVDYRRDRSKQGLVYIHAANTYSKVYARCG
ncbi:hypothetical protein FB451DRAFT_1262374 [Mycena latifolia]|nr:hypothetical protein FB451DRAFT_1262374 [Mycena latifolia]